MTTLYTKNKQPLRAQRTFVVLGCPRGGTSLISGILSASGVYMGDFTTNQYEDPKFKLKQHQFQNAVQLLSSVIAQRNQDCTYWGWKVPDTIYYIDAIQHLLINPCYLIIYRDEEAIARSSAFHDGRDWQRQGDRLREVARNHTGLVRAFQERCMFEHHAFQLEEIHAQPASFVARILDIVTPLRPESAQLLTLINQEGGYSSQPFSANGNANSTHVRRQEKRCVNDVQLKPVVFANNIIHNSMSRLSHTLTSPGFVAFRKAVKRNFPIMHSALRKIARGWGLHAIVMNKRRIYDEHSFEMDFCELEFSDLKLAICTRPQHDLRGIGRVTKELTASLAKLASLDAINKAQKHRGTIYFFSSIHWCPDVLPDSSIVMIHDVIPLLFPQLYPEQCAYWKKYLNPIVKQASAIVTISASSASDIISTLNVEKENVHVIYNGVTKLPVAKKTQINLPGHPYVVYLGQDDKHKNLDVILTALASPQLKEISIVIIGDNRSKNYQKKIRQLGIANRVYITGFLDDAAVGSVVSGALVMLLPSYYEGFGLPPFEAALLGVPSICSRRRAMTELLEGCVLFADPNQPDEWSHCIARLQHDRKLRQKLVCKSKNRASEFSWERSGKSLLKIIREIKA